MSISDGVTLTRSNCGLQLVGSWIPIQAVTRLSRIRVSPNLRVNPSTPPVSYHEDCSKGSTGYLSKIKGTGSLTDVHHYQREIVSSNLEPTL